MNHLATMMLVVVPSCPSNGAKLRILSNEESRMDPAEIDDPTTDPIMASTPDDS